MRRVGTTLAFVVGLAGCATEVKYESAGGSGSIPLGSGGSAGAGAPASGGATAITPLCNDLATADGLVPAKGDFCVSRDPQRCYKTCGPLGVGSLSETCTDGVYVESPCSFPPVDYSCFRIPAVRSAACAALTTAPQQGMVCSISECAACSDATGFYVSATGELKQGYCVCQALNADGVRTWSCATSLAWPCPDGAGCE